ncbi:hypothetical protein QE152_g4127 [Popillia japonica]|uniref:Uncharacterized protein n=1 Tax=Popillia japonica TaxID=7064 RepID=A0AAW1N1V8_POPJA
MRLPISRNGSTNQRMASFTSAWDLCSKDTLFQKIKEQCFRTASFTSAWDLCSKDTLFQKIKEQCFRTASQN